MRWLPILLVVLVSGAVLVTRLRALGARREAAERRRAEAYADLASFTRTLRDTPLRDGAGSDAAPPTDH